MGVLVIFIAIFWLIVAIVAIGKAMEKRELKQCINSGRAETVTDRITGVDIDGMNNENYFIVSYTTLGRFPYRINVRSGLRPKYMKEYIGTEVLMYYNPSIPESATANVPTVPKSQLPKEKLREKDDPRCE